jgi:23S rRNA (adenine(2503)-C(2))-methyltransferase
MDITKLEQFLTQAGQPKFRLQQVKKAIFQEGISAFTEISNLPKDLREALEQELSVLPFAIEKVLTAKDGQSIKALLKLTDGNLLETVLIAPKPGLWSACISSQVGCAMGCRFCATGKMGFKRNLTAEEIESQVLFWIQYLRKNNIAGNFSTIVYMGMGEPFLNWEAVSQSIRDLINPELFGFGSRSLSVSTSGITEGIERLATEFPQVNLALSLHFATDAKRDQYMPVNKKDNLESLQEALKKYFTLANRKVFLEYIMLEGVNDNESDAQDLTEFIYSIGKRGLLHVNLIRYNTTSENLQPSSGNRTQKFKSYLLQRNIDVTIRKSLGEEIQGACGQLAGK